MNPNGMYVAPVENDDVDITPDLVILPVSGADRNDGYAVDEPYLASGEADFPQQPMGGAALGTPLAGFGVQFIIHRRKPGHPKGDWVPS